MCQSGVLSLGYSPSHAGAASATPPSAGGDPSSPPPSADPSSLPPPSPDASSVAPSAAPVSASPASASASASAPPSQLSKTFPFRSMTLQATASAWSLSPVASSGPPLPHAIRM